MTRLEKCSCGQLAVVYVNHNGRKRWLCKVCESISRAENKNRAPGFILRGSGWLGKDIKGRN